MIKDSGEREEFTTGSVRDTSGGKGFFDLIPYLPLELLAKHYEEGIEKYGLRNWEKGQPLRNFACSALRHFTKFFLGGMRDENHLSAGIWNAMGYQWTENEIIEGRLPYSLTEGLHPKLLKHIDSEMEKRSYGGLIHRRDGDNHFKFISAK
jgi:hypothetical protein